jgi:hypothetical protein
LSLYLLDIETNVLKRPAFFGGATKPLSVLVAGKNSSLIKLLSRNELYKVCKTFFGDKLL